MNSQSRRAKCELVDKNNGGVTSDNHTDVLDAERVYHENVYQRRKPKVINSDDYYLKYAVPLDQGGRNHRYPVVKAHFDGLLESPGPRFLDCACGVGNHAIWLALNGKEVWAYDFSETAISTAKKSAELSGVSDKVNFDVMDGNNLAYEDGFFDILTGTDCVHHLIKYPRAIQELTRVLRVGGQAMFYEPLTRNPFINTLRAINIWWTKREGEHMLTRHDIEFLEDQFGEIRMSHHIVFSSLTRLIASELKPPTGIRRKICMTLIKLDRFLLEAFPSLEKYSAGCYVRLTKTKEKHQQTAS